jgi:hypothetical protein
MADPVSTASPRLEVSSEKALLPHTPNHGNTFPQSGVACKLLMPLESSWQINNHYRPFYMFKV